MKAKEALKLLTVEVDKGLAAIGKEDIKVRVRPRLVRHYIGVYFEKEIIERVSKRYRGEVPDSAMWAFKKEAHAWAQKVIALADIDAIDMAHFDRITESAIAKYNQSATELRQATSVALRASRKHDVKALVEGMDQEEADIKKYTEPPKPLKLGEVLEAK